MWNRIQNHVYSQTLSYSAKGDASLSEIIYIIIIVAYITQKVTILMHCVWMAELNAALFLNTPKDPATEIQTHTIKSSTYLYIILAAHHFIIFILTLCYLYHLSI